jgi:hypothetical protein
VTLLAADGSAVAALQSDQAGIVRFSAAPGSYLVRPEYVAGFELQARPQTATITATGTTRLTVTHNTGNQ